MYKVRRGAGKNISSCARKFAPEWMVDGSHPRAHPCMGINVTSGLWQPSRFNLYFNIYKQRNKKQGVGVGHAFEGLCHILLC